MAGRPIAFEELVARQYEAQKKALARAIAAELGPPSGSVPTSDRELVRMWGQRHPDPFGPEEIRAHFSLPPEHPRRHPKVERVLQYLKDGMMAEALTLWTYPYREDTYNREPTLKAQCAEAERIRRLATKGDDEMPAPPAAPVAPTAPPEMHNADMGAQPQPNGPTGGGY